MIGEYVPMTWWEKEMVISVIRETRIFYKQLWGEIVDYSENKGK